VQLTHKRKATHKPKRTKHIAANLREHYATRFLKVIELEQRGSKQW
jgi:hypothetical protein